MSSDADRSVLSPHDYPVCIAPLLAPDTQARPVVLAHSPVSSGAGRVLANSAHVVDPAVAAGDERLQAQPSRDILLIDDDPTIREVVSVALRDEGHTLEVAADGEEGLACLRQRHYRLLLLDLMMPRLDGLGVLHALRTEPALRPPAVLVLSALHRPADVLPALGAGADDYVSKPFDVDDLSVRVNLWLRRTGPADRIGPPGVRVHSLGRFYVEHEGHIRLHEGGRARKVNTLFKYLLTHQARTVPSAEVLALLWPQAEEELAATNLRSLLYQLRKGLRIPANAQSCLQYTGTTLALRLGPNDWWDAAEFTAWLAKADRWQRAGDTARALDAYAAGVALYAGDYLEEDAYADWVTSCRERLREDWLRALSSMAALHGERGEHEQQESVLRTVLRADPYREHAYRGLMALRMTQGRNAEARVLFRRLEELLRAEFGVAPDPETQALLTSHVHSVSPS